MPLAADIATYLDAGLGAGWTVGTNLFYGPMPEMPSDCLAVTAYAGENAAADRVMGPSLTAPQMETGRFQVASRSAVQATAIANSAACHALLDGFAGSIGGRNYYWIESINGEPHFLKQDQSAWYTYVADYRAKKERG